MLLKNLSLVFAALLCTQAIAAEKTKTILSFVDLGVTDKITLEQKFKERGCQIVIQDKMIDVVAPCFNLPEEKAISLALNQEDKVESVIITYTKSNKTFDLYKNALLDSHGTARIINNPYVGNKAAIWDDDNLHIELTEPNLAFDGSIVYITQEKYKQYEQEQERMQKVQDDINGLL